MASSGQMFCQLGLRKMPFLLVNSTGMARHLIKCRRGMQRRTCYTFREVDVASSKTSFTVDTHAMVKAMQEAQFTQQQGEVVVSILTQTYTALFDNINKNIVTNAQQEVMLQQIMSHMASLKKDMIILEKSEFSSLKHGYEKQNMEVEQIKKSLLDELAKLRSGISLDINLERSRAKEEHAANAGSVTHIKNQLVLHSSEQEKQIAKLDNKIDKEVANLLAVYERYRNDIMKYAAGTVMTCLTLFLGFYRIWMA